MRELHLNVFIHGRGHHEAAWRHDGASRLPLTEQSEAIVTGGSGGLGEWPRIPETS